MISITVLICMSLVFIYALVQKDTWAIFKTIYIGKIFGMAYLVLENSVYLGALYGFLFLFGGLISLLGMQRVFRKKQSSQNLEGSLSIQLIGIMCAFLMFGIISMFLYDFSEVIPEFAGKYLDIRILSSEFSKIVSGKRAMVVASVLITILIITSTNKGSSDVEIDTD